MKKYKLWLGNANVYAAARVDDALKKYKLGLLNAIRDIKERRKL